MGFRLVRLAVQGVSARLLVQSLKLWLVQQPTYVQMFVYIYIYTDAYTVYTYIYMYIHICIYTYIYI